MKRRESQYNPHLSSVHSLLQKLESRISPSGSSLLATVLDNAPIGFAYFDRRLRYRIINRMLAEINGLPMEEHLGKTVGELFPVLDAKIKPYMKKVVKTKKPVLDLELAGFSRKEPHRNRYWIVSFYPIQRSGGSVAGLGAIVVDITHQKEYEQFREDFFHMASHEIKNPLTAVKAYSHLIESNLRRSGDRRNADMAGRIENGANRINYLINTLMNVSKFETGNMVHNCERCDLGKIVQDTVADFKYAPTHHKIVLHRKVSASVYADKERIAEVLNNLISNAIKYSPGKNTVIISMKKTGRDVTTSIQDFGVGIPKDKLQLVFNKFYRGPGANANGSREGLGLGLYISSEIIKYYKGKIWVASTPGKGSTFYFTLPVSR